MRLKKERVAKQASSRRGVYDLVNCKSPAARKFGTKREKNRRRLSFPSIVDLASDDVSNCRQEPTESSLSGRRRTGYIHPRMAAAAAVSNPLREREK